MNKDFNLIETILIPDIGYIEISLLPCNEFWRQQTFWIVEGETYLKYTAYYNRKRDAVNLDFFIEHQHRTKARLIKQGLDLVNPAKRIN